LISERDSSIKTAGAPELQVLSVFVDEGCRGSEIRVNKVKIAAILFMSITAGLISRLPVQAQGDKASRSVWEGVFTKEQVKRGQGLYVQICSSCHGPDLAGNDEAAALTGSAFLSSWDGLSVSDLSNRVRVSMPPNEPGTLSRQQIVDILSYVLSVNGFPAGKAELDPRAEVLKLIRIEATKPKTTAGSN